MQKLFIGREKEKEILQDAISSHEAEMVAVIGRRRVGKTFLIKTTYKEPTIFEITGLQNATTEKQLEHFNYTMQAHANTRIPIEKPDSWLRAFRVLTYVLEEKLKDTTEKKVVFFDELPWLASNNSEFMTGLEFFWNSWAVNQNIVLVICGSAASWMIKNLVNNTGGLYNRITKRIYMQPFTLNETKQYFDNQHFNFSLYEMITLYMAMGGIPHYLKEVKGNKSAVQNIDRICFSETGLLRDEFRLMFFSLFENADKHIAIIRALATTNQGLTRPQLIALSKVSENGHSSRVLEELEQSGFIKSYHPFGKKKRGKLYRLTDEYALFYLKFIEDNVQEGSGTWQQLSQTQTYKTWSGYAFESICLKHVPQIKKALSIGGVYSLSSSFYKKGTKEEKGAQIDLLLDRNDSVITIFEIKFSNKTLVLTKKQAENLRHKLWVFQESTNTKKRLMLTLITTHGIKQNQHSLGLVQETLTLEALFLA